jgi:large subunit ribosomal protein L5
MAGDNPMREIIIDKLVVNIGTGSDGKAQESAEKLLSLLTGGKPVAARSKKRLPAFKISKGQEIGAFITLRGNKIDPIAKKLFDAVDNKIKESSVTDNSLCFGIREYIDISGVKYDPKIGMMGMNVNLSFRRKGLRVALRKRKMSKVPERHRKVSRDEIKEFIKKRFNAEIMQQ